MLTVGATARLVGVSVRTLHHYDEIGLVTPSARTHAGYRVYDDADVERLHQVLTYRELGFPLEQIATLLDDPSADALEHLSNQRDLLHVRIAHLTRMVAAVEDMMTAKKTGIALTAAEQAEIFGDDWLGDEYADEAQERWGDTAAWQQSQQRTAGYSKDDWRRIKEETDAFEHACRCDGPRCEPRIGGGRRAGRTTSGRHREVLRLRLRDAGVPGRHVRRRPAFHRALRRCRAGPGDLPARDHPANAEHKS